MTRQRIRFKSPPPPHLVSVLCTCVCTLERLTRDRPPKLSLLPNHINCISVTAFHAFSLLQVWIHLQTTKRDEHPEVPAFVLNFSLICLPSLLKPTLLNYGHTVTVFFWSDLQWVVNFSPLNYSLVELSR